MPLWILSRECGDDFSLLGVFSSQALARRAAREQRTRDHYVSWCIYECWLDQLGILREVWSTHFQEGPSSDGQYGWLEDDKKSGTKKIEHARTPEGYLYPEGFDGPPGTFEYSR